METSTFLHPAFYISVASMVFAQVVKPLFALLQGKGWSPARMFSTGGMPSSHRALVATMTLCVAHEEGSGSTLFSVALIFSIYFIFEATGLRQEVGQQARILNEMLDELTHRHQLNYSRLRELSGHTWVEVFGGILCGVLVYWIGRPFLGA